MEDEDLIGLDRVTQNCLRNQGIFRIYNSKEQTFCGVDKSNIPSHINFSCPYHNSTRMHSVDVAFTAPGCDYNEE